MCHLPRQGGIPHAATTSAGANPPLNCRHLWIRIGLVYRLILSQHKPHGWQRLLLRSLPPRCGGVHHRHAQPTKGLALPPSFWWEQGRSSNAGKCRGELKACWQEGAGAARDVEPAWGVWPGDSLQVARSITAASRSLKRGAVRGHQPGGEV